MGSLLGFNTENGEAAEKDFVQLAMKDDISSKQSYIFQLQSCCRLLSWDPSLLQNQSHIACPRLPHSLLPYLPQPPSLWLLRHLHLAPAVALCALLWILHSRCSCALGLDSALRFLMSIFGWFAVLISGRGDFDMYMYTGGL
jgi:hypothetical protein